MWLISLRDLEWRKRRFAIAILGTALVFSMTLLLAGVSASFRNEARRTIRAVGADRWVVPASAQGPFTSFASMPADVARAIAEMPGVERADPFVQLTQGATTDRFTQVMLFGAVPGGLGVPPVAEGRAPSSSGEALVDAGLGARVGESLTMGGRRFTVVGRTDGVTVLSGMPTVTVPLEDAQAIAFAGRPLATTVLVRGAPARLPDGVRALTRDQTLADLLHPLQEPIRALDMTQVLLWVVAVLIVGSVVYLTALERVRDFAVLKATGASSRALFGALAIQAGIVALVAGVIAIGLAQLLAPLFPMQVAIPAVALLLLPVIALLVGIAASLAGVRRAVTVDPALAFGGP